MRSEVQLIVLKADLADRALAITISDEAEHTVHDLHDLPEAMGVSPER